MPQGVPASEIVALEVNTQVHQYQYELTEKGCKPSRNNKDR